MALREEHDRAAPDYHNDRLAWEKAREAAVKKGRGDRASIKAELDKIGLAPSPPLLPMLTCPEPTFEGLCKLFALGQPSLGIFAAEGGQFIGSHGMSDDAKLRTAAGLSDVWDGSAIRRVRSGDGVSVLPGRRLSAHLMAQPAVADILFRDPLLIEQGLLSRLLVTAPDPTSGTRLGHEERPETELALRRYDARMLSIFERPLPLRVGMTNELEPRPITLSSAARQAWIEFVDHVEREVAPNGSLDAIRGLANKLPEHAARLAAVLTLVRDIETGEVAQAEMTAGIALAEHYGVEALRLFGGAQVKSEIRLAQRLLDWLLGAWSEPCISLPDIYQRSLNAISDKVYFICPGVVTGVACRRRVAKLHASGRYFLCRRCHRLGHASQSEDALDRAFRRANKIRQRLGSDPGMAAPFPPRPKGMWRRTYNRLRARAFAEMQAEEVFAIRAESLLSRIDDPGRRRPTRRKSYWR
jgi:hypothetical protein